MPTCTESRPPRTTSQPGRAELVFPVNPAETYQMTRLMLRLVVLAAVVLLGTCAAIVDTTKAFACSCAGISTSRALREADAVFRGTVVSKDVRGRGDAARTERDRIR